MSLLRFLAPTVLALSLVVPVTATLADDEPQTQVTVADIVKRGSINVGIILDSPPYGILDANQNPDGFSVDEAKLLAKYMGVKLNIVSLEGANRIPFLLSGKIDMVIAGISITPDRAMQVAFSAPISRADNDVYAPADANIKSVEDLVGKRIGVTRGGSQDTIITRDLDGRATIMRFDQNLASAQALISGQVDAMAVNDIIGDPAFAQAPQAHIEKKFILASTLEGIAMRKEDTDLLRWVNSFIVYAKGDGELNDIYQKWWKRPLPDMPSL